VPSDDLLQVLETGCEYPETFWTKQMRLEVLLALKNACDDITNLWDKQLSQDIKVVEDTASFKALKLSNKLNPVFPELKNNILIQNKFLQNLNKNPKFADNDNLMELMNRLVEYAQTVYDALYKKKSSSPEKNEHHQSPTKGEESKNNNNRLFAELTTTLTSLMFVLDYHIYGPKKTDTKKLASVIEEADEEDEEDRSSVAHDDEPYKPILDLCIDEHLLSFLSECVNLLNHSFFVVGTQLKVTLLQIFYLLTEDEKGLVFLKDVDMVQVIGGILRKTLQPTKFQSNITFVEEELLLTLLLKILHKEKNIVHHVIEECIDSLRELLHLKKPCLKELLENIVTLIAQNPEYGRDAFLEINKKESLVSVSTIHDCQPHALLKNFWKCPSHGWNPYNAKNTLNALLKQPKENKLHGPIVSEISVENLPDKNGEMKATQELIQNYLSKINQEHSE